MTQVERRFIPVTELRVAAEGAAPSIDGYAALFNSPSELLMSRRGVFRERILPGAFRTALASSDTRALFNHDPNYVLGRVQAGTLDVLEDARGLHMHNVPPETQWAKDLMTSMRRGDITQMSFGFKVADGGDLWETRNGELWRDIKDIAELLDVSPVTYPAYPDTSVAVRSLEAFTRAMGDTQDMAGMSPAAVESMKACVAACQACMDACNGMMAGSVSMADCMAACEACEAACEACEQAMGEAPDGDEQNSAPKLSVSFAAARLKQALAK